MSEQIYELIPKIMGDIGHVGKQSTNSFQHYNFRGIDDVYNCVGPVLVKHGVFIVPIIKNTTVNQVTTAGNKPATQIIIEVAYRFYAPDGSHIEAVTVGEGVDTGDKAANKAMSAAMKYAVWQTFCIPTVAVDSEEETPVVTSHAPPAAPQPTPPPAKSAAPTVESVKLECFQVFGADLCQKAKLQLIGADGEYLTADCKITTMGQANELKRILNTGDVK